MDTKQLNQISQFCFELPRTGKMCVPGRLFASAELLRGMDEMVLKQVSNVAALPGIVGASYAMPDAHWGYGFCIGGVAAFDPDKNGVVSAGGVGFDIACGVRTLHTKLKSGQLKGKERQLADALFRKIPAGVGSEGKLQLSPARMVKE